MGDLTPQRVQRGLAATVTATFTQDGVPTPPSPNTATVEVDSSSGVVLTPAGTPATPGAGGQFSLVLSPAQTVLLDTLTVKWTSALGTITTQVEVAGGFAFSLADARGLPALTNPATYPNASIFAARILAEQALEDACGVAFVPRYQAAEMIDGNYQSTILLRKPRPTLLRSVTVGGVMLSPSDLAQVILKPTGELYRPSLWPGTSYYGGSTIWGSQSTPGGSGNILVSYEHGYPAPPARVSRACLLLAKRWLVDSPVDERTTQVTTEGGTISFMAAGATGLFDLPEVLAVVEQYGHVTGVA